jgi:hypothetical protein
MDKVYVVWDLKSKKPIEEKKNPTQQDFKKYQAQQYVWILKDDMYDARLSKHNLKATKVERIAQEILSSKGNLMLIENSVMKIEKSIKSVIEWAEDIEDKNISNKIKSNVSSIIKEIAEIKKELK